ncbi:MAG: ATP-binding cassette domain-containing protein [Flavobacteriales bacterium]|jgi:ABC-type multidrug transport system ATPase subunit|nr:MAG: ATP-binding cassette domain-containing protein [Flavobacteriales bacterium]
MSEKILKALLQLFAIIAKGDAVAEGARPDNAAILARFLRKQFSPEVAAAHMARYQAYVQAFHASGGQSRSGRKRTSLNSVKVLKICTQVNEELNQHQKFVVLIHLLEFVNSNVEVTEQEAEFVATVAETFNIVHEDFLSCRRFVELHGEHREDAENLLYIDAAQHTTTQKAKHIHAHGLEGEIRVLHVPSVNLYVMRYSGAAEVTMNGQRMGSDSHFVLSNGTSVRPPNGVPIYYSDILAAFMQKGTRSRIVFKADAIEYAFPNGRIGLHELRLAETGGKLIGIMGGSGSGKSTLLNILNGNLKPSRGRVTINGIDVHTERERIRGVIGHVSQDDLLIEELSVYQNLFYNAKLCFGDLSDEQVGERVLRMLQTLGLFESKDLKVGSPLEKTISGGQRKRLNIALELIREPSVLFVDEPTSGLSSRDSENIMDLLKELALKGRLVFVVIHQPSSDIFKLFDRLLLMDQEGHPVYYGDPVDAVVYFKRVTGQVNSEVGQCGACGNVNPEQIFNILEAKLVDEYGNETDQRRIGPEAWNEVFRAQMEGRVAQVAEERSVPKSTFTVPGRLRQLKVYFQRDLLSKLANRQYVLINMVEAPALAFIMAFFLKFHRVGHGLPEEYVFRQNDNIPQYLFIAVIVALFLGLTVSAEEIIRDRKILAREKFLDLSWMSYLLSKVGILFLISAIQTGLFVLVGHAVLGIQGQHLQHWLLLFSASCFANVLGLNVSASFNSAKVIYIMIPVLIIPQLLFSGIIVKFDKLHPWFASQRSVPVVGNVMASRWAYEGLAVTQFMDNRYEREFYALDQRMKNANWKKDLWVRELESAVSNVRRALNGFPEGVELEHDLGLLRTELAKEARMIKGFSFQRIAELEPDKVNAEVLDELTAALNVLTQHYRNVFKAAEAEKEQRIARMTADPERRAQYFALINGHRNESLADVVTNKNEVNVIVTDAGELIQKSDPIYLEPTYSGFFGAQFYAPAKWLGGIRVPTLAANTLVLWAMSLLLAMTLYFELFPRLLKKFGGRAVG